MFGAGGYHSWLPKHQLALASALGGDTSGIEQE